MKREKVTVDQENGPENLVENNREAASTRSFLAETEVNSEAGNQALTDGIKQFLAGQALEELPEVKLDEETLSKHDGVEEELVPATKQPVKQGLRQRVAQWAAPALMAVGGLLGGGGEAGAQADDLKEVLRDAKPALVKKAPELKKETKKETKAEAPKDSKVDAFAEKIAKALADLESSKEIDDEKLKKEVEPAIKKVLAESLLRSAALNEKIANMWAKVEVFIKQGKTAINNKAVGGNGIPYSAAEQDKLRAPYLAKEAAMRQQFDAEEPGRVNSAARIEWSRARANVLRRQAEELKESSEPTPEVTFDDFARQWREVFEKRQEKMQEKSKNMTPVQRAYQRAGHKYLFEMNLERNRTNFSNPSMKTALLNQLQSERRREGLDSR